MSVPTLAIVRPLYEGPEVPEDVLKRIRQINAQLGLRFYQGSGWAVMWRWRENDPRRAYIQRGELPADEDADIVCYLPDGCGAAEAASYIESRARQHPVAHIHALVDDLARQRDAQQEAAFRPVMDEALNEIEVHPENLFATTGRTITRLRGAGFGKGRRTEVNRGPNEAA